MMNKNTYANNFEAIFENHDILGNPFMEYTKVELEQAFNTYETVYSKSAMGSAPRRQAFNAMASIEIAFDAYARAIKQFNVYVDNETTLRDVLEDSHEISTGAYKSLEELRKAAGLPAVVTMSSDLLDTTVEKTKEYSKKASNTFFDGLASAGNWLLNVSEKKKK